MHSVMLLREGLVDALTQAKEPKVNILGVNISRQPLLQALKINKQGDVLTLSYGNISWPEAKAKFGGQWITTPALDSQPCLQISLDHTTMRFLDKPAEYIKGTFEGTTYLNILTERITEPTAPGINILEFLPALQHAMTYAATDDTRPILHCILFEFSGTKLTLVGADGFRLGVFKVPCKLKYKPFTLDTSDLVKVCHLIKAAKATGTGKGKSWPDIYMAQDKDSVTFTCQYASVKCLKVTGNYPAYQTLIPKAGTKVEVMAWQLLEAVQNANVAARDGSGIVRLVFTGNEASISAVSQEESESQVKIPAKVEAACKVAANGRYLADTLKQIGDAKVKIFVTTPSSPIRFEWPGNTVVIMPMFVQWGEDKD